jgi:hypothetical protein
MTSRLDIFTAVSEGLLFASDGSVRAHRPSLARNGRQLENVACHDNGAFVLDLYKNSIVAHSLKPNLRSEADNFAAQDCARDASCAASKVGTFSLSE